MNMIKRSMRHAEKFIIMLSLIITPSFAAVISITPSTSQVSTGSQFCADIMVADLGVNEKLGAFDLNLQYDPSILEFTGYSLTNELGSISDNLALDLSSGLINQGEVNISGLSLLDNLDSQLSTFKLASVVFNAVNQGTSILGFSDVTLGNYFGNAIGAVIQNSSVQAVPETSPMALISMGIFSFAGIILCRKKFC